MSKKATAKNRLGSSSWLATSSWLMIALLVCLSLLSSRSGVLPVVEARAILGVDLGSLYMKVALVQSGSPLEIVTNLHSKRKTEQMILFDREQRFYGADAKALLARKSQKTPTAMSVLLGRDDQHPVVQVLAERHYPVTPVYNETRTGVVLTVDGVDFTPEELVAMVLQHAVDISVAHAAAQGSAGMAAPKDCVLTVPSYATQRERQALLNAAALAQLNVLTLMDETTAAALNYAMDKTFADADNKASQDQVVLFYNMGASALQVSLVHFYSHELPQKYGKPKRVPALHVLAKAWDATLGGDAFDHLLVEHLADEFNTAWRKDAADDTKDVRTVPRAMAKLRIQANKVKHVLSANADIPVFMESLTGGVNLNTHVTREQLEQLAQPLLARAMQPVQDVLDRATAHYNKTWSAVTGVELIGGGMRIPRIQAELQSLLQASDNPALELGLHINADESMALGAAFGGANISTAFKVRHVGLTDINPFGMAVSLENLETADKAAAGGEEEWKKRAVIFKPFGKIGVKKTIAFTHDQDVACALDYDDADDENDLLPAGSEHGLERYKITGVQSFAKEMAEKGLEKKPKVSLQFELSSSGIASLIKAEAAVEETYTVEEEVEVEDDEAEADDKKKKEDDAAKTTEADKKEDGDKADDKKEDEADKKKDGEEAKDDKEKKEGEDKKDEKKPKKTKIIQKEKKRVHKRTLEVETYSVGRVQPHTPEQLEASKAKLLDMAVKDKERMMLEESRNKLESYIYHVKNTINDKEEELAQVSTEEQREECMKLALDAQEWMDDDGYGADFATLEDKYASLSTPFERIKLRLKEKDERPKAVKALQKKLDDVEKLLTKWEKEKPQITEEERTGVKDKVAEVRKWIADQEEAQAKKEAHEDPAFLSKDVPGQSKPVEVMVLRLSKKPKPKPPKKEENATSPENATDSSSGTSTTDDASSKGEDEEGKKEEEDAPPEKKDEEASSEEKVEDASSSSTTAEGKSGEEKPPADDTTADEL